MLNLTPQETLCFYKGDIVFKEEQPNWALSLIGDYPAQYHWIYPEDSAYPQRKAFKIMCDVTLERHENAVVLSITRTIQ